MKFTTLFPGRHESEGSRQFKSIFWGIVIIFVLALAFGSLSFLLTLQGTETIMTPDIEDMFLLDAMEELQSRGLITHIQSRFFEAENGTVINQRPDAGSQVRVGRTITLTVSKGPVLNQVGNYVGMRVQDLKQQLATQFAIHEPLLEVKTENISYIFSEEPEQVILDQDPSAGYELSEYTELTLLVSRGPAPRGTEAPETIGLDYLQALGMLAARNIPFTFRISDPGGISGQGSAPGNISDQNSDPGGISGQGNAPGNDQNSSNTNAGNVGIVLSQQPAAGEVITEYLELFISPLGSSSGSAQGSLSDSSQGSSSGSAQGSLSDSSLGSSSGILEGEIANGNQESGIFSALLPYTFNPAIISVEFVNSLGEVQPYFQTIRRGGEISFPYVYENGSSIRIYLNGELLP
ncbi:MAG: PASTA domain-containing protein [Salinispira sp.]